MPNSKGDTKKPDPKASTTLPTGSDKKPQRVRTTAEPKRQEPGEKKPQLPGQVPLVSKKN